jgi:hypothetical protein
VGAVLLDIAYSRSLESIEGFLAGPAVYSEVSDLMLIPGALTVLFAVVAIVASWPVRPARNLFMVSAMLFVGFEFLAPVVLFPVLRSSAGSFPFGLGPWIRLVPATLASLFAFAAVRDLYLQRDGARPA